MAKETGAGGHQGGGGRRKAARDNRADQLNPNNDKYHRARGSDGRPEKSGGDNPSRQR